MRFAWVPRPPPAPPARSPLQLPSASWLSAAEKLSLISSARSTSGCHCAGDCDHHWNRHSEYRSPKTASCVVVPSKPAPRLRSGATGNDRATNPLKVCRQERGTDGYHPVADQLNEGPRFSDVALVQPPLVLRLPDLPGARFSEGRTDDELQSPRSDPRGVQIGSGPSGYRLGTFLVECVLLRKGEIARSLVAHFGPPEPPLRPCRSRPCHRARR